MVKIFSQILVFFIATFQLAFSQSFYSPNKSFECHFKLTEKGEPAYKLLYKNQEILSWSTLGLKTKAHQLSQNFEIYSHSLTGIDDVWQPVLGEYKSIENQANEFTVALLQKETQLRLNIIFRLYDSGLAFRYEVPTQEKLHYFELTDELSSFQLTADHHTFWIPADFDSQEHVYNETLMSKIDSKLAKDSNIGLQTFPNQNSVQSPLLMKSKDKIYMQIFEAAVENYPVMHLAVDTSTFNLTSLLATNAGGSKAFLRTAFKSPWRTILASSDAKDMYYAAKTILNLNEPCAIKDTSWIKPMKYIGIWWEMHLGTASWDYALTQSGQLQPHGRHGATTENTKRYIDFAAKHGFDGVLVEGWNVGWEDWYGKWKEDVFDFVTPYPDFDLKAIHQYAKAKGVKMIMHHETSAAASNYERWLDRAMNVMKHYDYPAVKTGYVGRIIPRGEYHDGQTMVNHFHHVLKRMADNQLKVNSHESSRPTGFQRTYPNFIASEAARGNEFNAWSRGNPPSHETILPFTRLVGGAMDYTPGIFEIELEKANPSNKNRIHTTLAKQLALYVVLYSPLQMAADLPQHYDKYLDAFQFIKDVALDWDETIVLEAEPGDYLTIARKEKQSEKWFLGAITDENKREANIKLSFLQPNKKYQAIIYQDGQTADYINNPKAYEIKTIVVNNQTTLPLKLARSGGVAISFKVID
jgi:hypothetical protein